MYSNVDIRNGCYGVVKYNKDGNEIAFMERGKAVYLEGVSESIENGDISWRLSFSYLGKQKYIDLPKQEISDKKLIALLAGKGADVTAKYFDAFIDSLRLQEAQINSAVRSYKNVGWIRVEEEDQGLQWRFRCCKLVGAQDGEYTGDLVLKPQGTINGWTSMVKEEVLGKPALETVLVAALSAVVVGLIVDVTTGENPIVHMNFSSGKGKSTVCYLAASTAGEPFDGKKQVADKHGVNSEKISVYGSWGSTEKATITSHAGNHGMVAVLNELGKFAGRDMTEIVFNLSEGTDIVRLNKELKKVLSEGFATTFISCGEMSLVKRCKRKLEGLNIRVLEIEEQMTVDADHSRRIKDGARKHNGWATPKLAKFIIDNGSKEMVKALYDQVLLELLQKAPCDISDRFIEKFPAFFVTTARLAKYALGLEFDESAIIEFCYRCYRKSADSKGEVDESYEDILEECRVNVANFYHSSQEHPPKVLWGSVKYPRTIDGDRELVAEYGLRKSVLKELLEAHGHENVNTCLAKWKTAGVLDHEKGRNTRERVINALGKKEDLYVLQEWRPYVKKGGGSNVIRSILASRDSEDSENFVREGA